MAPIVYLLCTLTASLCAYLSFRAFRQTKARLLMWSALCFTGLTINNLILVVDRILLPDDVDLSKWRLFSALVAMLPLLYGLIWDDE